MIQSSMKNLPRLASTCCALVILVSGCANDPSSSHRSAAAAHEPPDPIEIPPRVGMTRDQVVAQYGRPRGINVTDWGESWHYILNAGEIATKSLIPFYLPPRPRFGTVIFGRDGRVTEFHWQTDPQA